MSYQDFEPGSLDRLLEVFQAFEGGEISPFDFECELLKFGVPNEVQEKYLSSILGGMMAGAILKEDQQIINRVTKILQKISSRPSN